MKWLRKASACGKRSRTFLGVKMVEIGYEYEETTY